MPTALNDDVSIHYAAAGEGDDAVVFVGDVGFGAWQWAWQHRAVAGPFRTLTFDHRGVGRSDAPDGPYTVAELAGDVEAVLADADVGRAHLVGAGLGGLVGLDLAADSRVRSLTLVGCGLGDPTPMDAFAPPDDTTALRSSTEALLSPAFRRSQPEVVDRIVEWRAAEDAPRPVWEAQTAAVDGYDPPPLYEVTTPALVVHGADDEYWHVDAARTLADDLPRGEFVSFEDAGRLVGVERSRVVNDRLVGLVESDSASSSRST